MVWIWLKIISLLIIKKRLLKQTPYGETSAIGIVGNRYKVFQNAEIFGALDNLIDSAGT
jgi:hypothetical protein